MFEWLDRWYPTSQILSMVRYFFTERPPAPPLPRKTLIHFQCNGCMGTDYQEVKRGVIVGSVSRKVGATLCDYHIVMQDDGSVFEAYKPYCSPGRAEQQKWTENPDESLVGKTLYLT